MGLVMPGWAKYLITYGLISLLVIACVMAIYVCGVTDERERQESLDNAKLAAYGQRILNLQNKARDDERASVNLVNSLTVNYEKRIRDAQLKTQSVLHNVSTGAVRLRVSTRANVPASGDSAAKISTLTSPAGEGSAELSEAAAGFLVGLASECDSAVEKLNLAIDVAVSDREATTPSLRATPSKEGELNLLLRTAPLNERELSAEFIPLRNEGVARSDGVVEGE